MNNDEEAQIREINKAALARPLLQKEDGELIDLSRQPDLKIMAIY